MESYASFHEICLYDFQFLRLLEYIKIPQVPITFMNDALLDYINFYKNPTFLLTECGRYLLSENLSFYTKNYLNYLSVIQWFNSNNFIVNICFKFILFIDKQVNIDNSL